MFTKNARKAFHGLIVACAMVSPAHAKELTTQVRISVVTGVYSAFEAAGGTDAQWPAYMTATINCCRLAQRGAANDACPVATCAAIGE